MSIQQTLRTYRDWVPVLMFHEVVPDGTNCVPPYAVTQGRLREILRDFSARGYRSGTLEDVMRGLGTPGRTRDAAGLEHKKLVLTFDDGTRDFIENALPALQEFDFSATLFIVTGMVGGERAWGGLHGESELPRVPLMSARELRELQGMGFTLGSHTVSHRPLTAVSECEAREEITASKEMLSDLLGEPVRWFAYPYLVANDRTRAHVSEAGYEAACGGPHQTHSPYYLHRIDASLYTTAQLRLRCNGLYQLARLAYRRARGARS